MYIPVATRDRFRFTLHSPKRLKREAKHLHHDVRFLFRLKRDAPVELDTVGWVIISGHRGTIFHRISVWTTRITSKTDESICIDVFGKQSYIIYAHLRHCLIPHCSARRKLSGWAQGNFYNTDALRTILLPVRSLG